MLHFADYTCVQSKVLLHVPCCEKEKGRFGEGGANITFKVFLQYRRAEEDFSEAELYPA